MMNMGGFGIMGGWGMLLFWALTIALIIWVARLFTRADSMRTESAALDIARQRYARGEIDREEFNALTRDLER